jgi:hypothetical protein
MDKKQAQTQTTDSLLANLQTSPDGLTTSEALRRLARPECATNRETCKHLDTVLKAV